jgi:chromosome segregation ATPase
MLKKLVIAAAAIVVGLGIVKFTKVGQQIGGVVKVWMHKSGDWCKNQITPETRIEQLELEIADINKDVRTAVSERADLKAKYLKLKDEVDALKAVQEERKKDLLALADVLEQGSANEVSFKGLSYSTRSAQLKLDNLKTAYELGEQTLKAKNNHLDAKAQQLELAQENILLIQKKEGELRNQVEQMKIQLADVRQKQSENNATVNNSQIAKCEQLLEEVKDAIRLERVRAEENARFGLTSPVSTPAREERNLADSIKAARKAVGADDKVAGNK